MGKILTQEEDNAKIEALRLKMIDAASQYGMTHPLVIRYSQELDRALNKVIISELSKSQEENGTIRC